MGTNIEVVLTSTHNLCFEQKYEKAKNFLSENFHFLVVKFSIHLNRRVFVMSCRMCTTALDKGHIKKIISYFSSEICLGYYIMFL